MTRPEIKNRILKVLEQEILKRNMGEIDDDAQLGETGLGLDSLNFLKFLTVLEKEFGVKIDDDYWDYKQFNSLNLVIDYFESRSGKSLF